MTLRNQRFLRKINPVCARTEQAPAVGMPQESATPENMVEQSESPALERTVAEIESTRHNVDFPRTPTRGDTPQRPCGTLVAPRRLHEAEVISEPMGHQNAYVDRTEEAPQATIEKTPPRRSSRQRRATVRLSAKLHGQSHV